VCALRDDLLARRSRRSFPGQTRWNVPELAQIASYRLRCLGQQALDLLYHGLMWKVSAMGSQKVSAPKWVRWGGAVMIALLAGAVLLALLSDRHGPGRHDGVFTSPASEPAQ
jgi:hypothetical protein